MSHDGTSMPSASTAVEQRTVGRCDSARKVARACRCFSLLMSPGAEAVRLCDETPVVHRKLYSDSGTRVVSCSYSRRQSTRRCAKTSVRLRGRARRHSMSLMSFGEISFELGRFVSSVSRSARLCSRRSFSSFLPRARSLAGEDCALLPASASVAVSFRSAPNQ